LKFKRKQGVGRSNWGSGLDYLLEKQWDELDILVRDNYFGRHNLKLINKLFPNVLSALEKSITVMKKSCPMDSGLRDWIKKTSNIIKLGKSARKINDKVIFIDNATQFLRATYIKNPLDFKTKKYRPFSDQNNIEKMVRYLNIFPEEETLEVTLFNWKGNPYRENIGNWVKYVSARDKNPRKLYLYWDKKIEDVFLDKIIKDLLNDKNYFSSLENYFFDSYRKFKAFTDKIFSKKTDYFSKKTEKELVEFFKKFNNVHRYALAAYYVSYDVALLLPRLVKKDLKENFKNFSDKKINNLIQIFSSVGITSIVRTERMEFLKTLGKVQKIYRKDKDWNNGKIGRLILEHWYKFSGCSFTHRGDPFTLEEYQKKIFDNLKLNSDKEIRKMEKERERDKKIVEKHLRRFRSFPEILKYIDWLRRFMGYRNCDEEYYHTYFHHSLKFFDEISKRLKLEGDDMWLLSKAEIIGSLAGKINYRKIIRERKKRGYTIKQVGNKIKVFTGVKKEDFHERNVEKVKILKGFVAFKGKVKGRAKIISDPTEGIKAFNKEDILITSMTTPYFVPLIKKAKAIVTDEGGLLCHAAIVARELKKPCIIGTKIATKILKDGDLIEVDAINGMVKILK